ncbi:MAG: hypothetical protein A3G75_01215 [Verrucomicrobia bacterium RIFCSPLOWO2_12_FULL_64_8]|nr:MAG: hypothetical protein A3G75_01215 [Verrucomicrobia bacterium RIFCSPLOWO2_12_FULL_64_8]
MKGFESQWRRLVAVARQAPESRDTAAPPGFATRVAARALSAGPPGLAALFERLSFRALVVACLLVVATLALSYPALTGGDEDEEQLVIDPVGELLAAS